MGPQGQILGPPEAGFLPQMSFSTTLFWTPAPLSGSVSAGGLGLLVVEGGISCWVGMVMVRWLGLRLMPPCAGHDRMMGPQRVCCHSHGSG